MILLTSHEVTWRQADHDVHVATVLGEYAGFVHDTDAGARACGAQGQDLSLIHI